MPFAAGTRIGRYVIRSLIGVGGMGEVYRAEDRMLMRPVAIKFVRRPEGAAGAEAQRRFLREARTTSQLNHPNIVTVYEVCEADDHNSIVMEYVEGRNLRSLILGGDLRPEAVFDLAAQVADALAAAHARGVIHRDIKPENIIVNNRAQAKLLDFGLARAFDLGGPAGGDEVATTAFFNEQVTGPDVVVGTIPYMSPEQLRKEEPLDARTDVFSFGVVLYEALTGRHPFPGANVFEAGAAILGVAPARLDPLSLPGGEEAARLLRLLLEKDKERRASSFEGIRRGLVSIRGQLSGPEPSADFYATTVSADVPALKFSAARGEGPAAPPRPASAPAEVPAPARARAAAPPGRTPTVLVLPLDAADAQDESASIGVGLASVIRTGLARVEGVSVISKSAGEDSAGPVTRETARVLGADILLEGEVMRAAGKVRVMARLTDAASGRVVWGGQYQGDESELFGIQDKVCEGVAAALRVHSSRPSGDVSGPAAPANMDAFVFYSKGRAFLERREVSANLDHAVRMFEESLKLDSSYAPAQAGLGEALWLKYEETRDSGLLTRARAACDRALVLDPRQPEVHVSLGIVYHGTGKLRAAIEEFERAAELQPLGDEAHKWLGRCLLEAGDPERAISHLKRAIEIRPGYWDNHNRLGICYYTLGRYEKAAEQFRRVISIQPDNYHGYNNLGGMYYLLGQFEDAAAMHRRAIEIHPAAISYSNLGSNYVYLGRFDEAIEAHREAIRLDPNNYLSHRNLGDALQRVGESDEARKHYEVAANLLEEALAVKPNDGQLLGRLAVCRAKLGRSGEALEDIERAAQAEPYNATLLYQRAVVYALTGRPETAVAHLAEALAHGYSRAEAERDFDLELLRSLPQYHSLLAEGGEPSRA